jgi:hypothetical protein
MVILTAGSLSAQSLDDFYEKNLEFYTPFSGMSSTAESLDTLGMEKSLNFWGIADFGARVCNTNRFGCSYFVDERQIGDLFFLLKGVLSKNAKNKDFGGINYLSDLGFLPNIRFGLNVFARDNTVINVGLYHSYYITQTGFITNGHTVFQNNDWLSVGPNIYFDRAITDFFAVRLSTGPMFTYANGKKEKENVPHIWENKFEVFTKWGIFAGVDFLKFSKLHDDMDDNIKIIRYDVKIGIRVRV